MAEILPGGFESTGEPEAQEIIGDSSGQIEPSRILHSPRPRKQVSAPVGVETTQHSLKQHTYILTDMHLMIFEQGDEATERTYYGIALGAAITSGVVLLTVRHLSGTVEGILIVLFGFSVLFANYWRTKSNKAKSRTASLIAKIREEAGVSVQIAKDQKADRRLEAFLRSIQHWKKWYQPLRDLEIEASASVEDE